MYLYYCINRFFCKRISYVHMKSGMTVVIFIFYMIPSTVNLFVILMHTIPEKITTNFSFTIVKQPVKHMNFTIRQSYKVLNT